MSLIDSLVDRMDKLLGNYWYDLEARYISGNHSSDDQLARGSRVMDEFRIA